MAIYAYVYAPVSGTIVARPGGYCSGGSHPTVCTQNPFDVTGGSAVAIRFTASSNIQSIRTTYTGSGVCYRGSEIPEPWDAKLKVDFYLNSNGQNLVGSVCYAHVTQPIANGTYNVNSTNVGYIPVNCSCQCATGCKCGGYQSPPAPDQKGYCANTTSLCPEKCPCRCCYGGTHVHMEGGSDYNTNLSCNQSVGLGTWMYRWVVAL